MGTRVRKIETPAAVAAGDRLTPEAFEVARLDLAPKLGGNVNFAVKATAEHFAPRKLGEVTANEIRASLDAIVTKTKVDGDAGDSGRFPFDEGAQGEWDRKRWGRVKGLLSALQEALKKGEITAPVSTEAVDKIASGLEADQVAYKAARDIREDGAKEPCGSLAHKDEKEFQPTGKNLVARGEDGKWVPRRHKSTRPGQEPGIIRQGSVLDPALQAELHPELDPGTNVFYCDVCKDIAWEDASEKGLNLVFYTRDGAANVRAAMARTAAANAGREEQKNRMATAAGRHSGPRPNKVDRLNARFSRRGSN